VLPLRNRQYLQVSAGERMSTHRTKAQEGFSMIELLVVVAILIVMVGLAIPNLVTTSKLAKQRKLMDSATSLFKMARSQAIKENRTTWVRFTDTASGQVMWVGHADSPDEEPADSNKKLPLPPDVSYVPNAVPDGCGALTSSALWNSGGKDPDGSKDTYFDPQGIPCDSVSATVCTAGLPTVRYFKYSGSGGETWIGVGVSSAGQVKAMYCNGSKWLE
jgi:type II secretory pathway pseudopilin PulG